MKMYGRTGIILVVIVLFISSFAHAGFLKKGGETFRLKTPSLNGWQTNIHLYWDLMYTHMGDMPMEMEDEMGEEMIGVMKKQRYLDQHQMNILFDITKDKLRFRTNLQSHSLFNAGSQEYALPEGRNEVRLLEYYGDYTYRDNFKIRAGKFLAPFGIYNDIRFVMPLYATVVLPFMYEPPSNHFGEQFYPPDANFMVYGDLEPNELVELEYSLYYAGGKRDEDSIRLGKEEHTFGYRSRMTYQDKWKLGVSVYTAKLEPAIDGREIVAEIDVEAGPFKGISLQAEFAKGWRQLLDNRKTYNVRLTYDLGYISKSLEKFTPYIMFDRLDDDVHQLLRKQLNRYGIGLAIRLTNNFYLKNEFHYHDYAYPQEGELEIPKNVRNTDMFKTAFILAF